MDELIIMPYHIHGIFIITHNIDDIKNKIHGETIRRVVATNDLSTNENKQTLQPNSLGSIIGQFESIFTKKDQTINISIILLAVRLL